MLIMHAALSLHEEMNARAIYFIELSGWESTTRGEK